MRILPFMSANSHLSRLRQSLNAASTVGALATGLESSGFGLALLCFCLPFLQPVPTPGLSTPVGLLLLLLGLQVGGGSSSLRLPRFVADAPVSPRVAEAIAGAAIPFFRFTERWTRPRWPWLSQRRPAIGATIACMALVLMLPIPLPFSNSLSAGPIALFALGLLEDDGIFIGAAFAASALGLLYHLAIFRLGVGAAQRIWIG